MTTKTLPPLAVTQTEAIALIRSPKIFKRALAAGWIIPVIQGGLGRRSLFDYGDVVKLWERLQTGEVPPKLRCEIGTGWIALEFLAIVAMILTALYLLLG